MRVRAERVDSAWLLHLEGRLTVEEDTRDLHELVRSMVQFDPYNLVLDLGNVEQLDCSGIGQLVQLNNQVRGSGGAFTLLNVEPRQKRLLRMLGLLTVFPVFDRRQEAIANCRRAAARACGLPSARFQATTATARPSIDALLAQPV
jgi:anti-sigma B factor antagonist